MRLIASAQVTATGFGYQQQIETTELALSASDSDTRFKFISDEPVSAGGQGSGPAPYQLYLAGLGACTAMTLQMYAERKQWDLGSIRIDLELKKDADGNAHIERSVHLSGPLDDAQWARLLEIAGKTPVSLTVKRGAPITDQRGE